MQSEEELDRREEELLAKRSNFDEEYDSDDDCDGDGDYDPEDDDEVARAAVQRKGDLRDGRGVPRAVRDPFMHDHAGRPCAAGLHFLRLVWVLPLIETRVCLDPTRTAVLA